MSVQIDEDGGIARGRSIMKLCYGPVWEVLDM